MARASRSLRACSIAGDGMVNFGVPRFTTDFRNLKWSSMLGLERRIFPVTLNSGGCSPVPWKVANLFSVSSTPSKP